MAAYKDLIGQKITKVTSNPGEPKTGQMWYNSTDGKLRGLSIVEAYSSGAPVTTARRGMSSSKNGTQDAMFGAGGYAAGPSTVASTEEYNGSGFSAGGNLSNARYAGTGAGTLTAGLAIGAAPDRTLVEEYDGTSWTAGGAMSTGRGAYDMGCGTQTAAMTAGGFLPPNAANTNATEHYNGSSWTGSGNLTDSRRNHSGCGIQTAAVTFAGDLGPSTTNQVQNYDGSSWTNVTTTPATIVQYMAFGTQTNSIYAGGSPPTTATSFKYDGTSISSGPAMATGRAGAANAGSGTAGIVASGMTTNPTTFTADTEEYNVSTNTVTAAAWASGGNLNTPRKAIGGGYGTQTAGLIAGGHNPSNVGVADSEEYNGTSWTEGNNMNTARGWLAVCGTQTAGLGSGGYPGPPATTGVVATEEYDGSSWTNGGDLNQEVYGGIGFGTQTAGVKAGGYNNALPPGNVTAQTEEYNGSSWSVNPNGMGVARYVGGGSGTATAGLVSGGYRYSSPAGRTAVTEEYDGTNWTTGGSLNIARNQTGVSGTQTATLLFGGNSAPQTYSTHTESYDGTAWSTRPSLGTGRNGGGGSFAGTPTSAFYAGGSLGPPGQTNATEEFTGETETANITDFTTS